MTNELPSHDKLLRKLCTLIEKLPGGDNYNTRSRWLGNLPNVSRDQANNNNDIDRIIRYLDRLGLEEKSGKWAVETFFENAIADTEGFDTGTNVKEVLDQYRASKQKQEGAFWPHIEGVKESEQQNDEESELYELLKPVAFDLITLVRNCMRQIEDRQGLIGISVPYDNSDFLKNFSERIKDKLGKKITVIRGPLDLDDYRTVKVDINTIKSIKGIKTMPHHNLISSASFFRENQPNLVWAAVDEVL